MHFSLPTAFVINSVRYLQTNKASLCFFICTAHALSVGRKITVLIYRSQSKVEFLNHSLKTPRLYEVLVSRDRKLANIIHKCIHYP